MYKDPSICLTIFSVQWGTLSAIENILSIESVMRAIYICSGSCVGAFELLVAKRDNTASKAGAKFFEIDWSKQFDRSVLFYAV